MILGIEKELSIFIQAILAGNITYFVYTMLRVFRRILKHNLFWISLEDILYWIGTGLYLFICAYQSSNGSIRWYFVLGVLLGGTITHSVVSTITKKSIEKRKKQ